MALKIAQMIVSDISLQTGCEVDLDPSLQPDQGQAQGQGSDVPGTSSLLMNMSLGGSGS